MGGCVNFIEEIRFKCGQGGGDQKIRKIGGPHIKKLPNVISTDPVSFPPQVPNIEFLALQVRAHDHRALRPPADVAHRLRVGGCVRRRHEGLLGLPEVPHPGIIEPLKITHGHKEVLEFNDYKLHSSETNF